MKASPVFWFTGLSGAGKTTTAEGVKKRLEEDNFTVLILDGDDVRNRLHRNLGFSKEEIKENNALISGLCAKHHHDYDVVMVPIISPYADSRARAREELGNNFFEIYFSASLNIVTARDTKGLYEKARNGEMDNLIGFSDSSPYEPPDNPDLVIDSGTLSPEEAIIRLYNFILNKSQRQKTR